MPSGTSHLDIVIGGNAESAVLAFYDLGYKAEAAGKMVGDSMRSAVAPIMELGGRGVEAAAELGSSLNEASERILGVRVNAEAMGNSVREGTERAVTGLREMGRSAVAAGDEVLASGHKAEESEGMFSKFGELGAMAGGWIGLAFGVEELGKKFFELGGDLEQSLNLITALTHDNNDASMSMVQIKATLEGNATTYAKYGYSVAQASDALGEMIKAHHSAADSMTALIPILQLARATQVDTGSASEFLSNTLNTYSLAGNQAQAVADGLSQAFHLGTASATDMQYAMTAAGAEAHASGVSFQQTAAMIVEMSKAGIVGSQAGTSIKEMLLRLNAPSAAASKEMANMGVSIYDASGKMRSAGDIVQQFSEKSAKMTQEQRNAAFATIFGTRAINAANAIFPKGVAGLNEYTSAINKQGAANDAAMAKTAGLSGAVNRMTALFDSGMEILYMKTAPALAKGLNAVVSAVLRIGSSVGPMVSKFNIMDGIKVIIGSVVKAVQIFWKSFTSNGGVKAIHGIFSDIQKDIGKLTGVIQTQLIPWFKKLLPTIEPIIAELGKVWSKELEFIRATTATVVSVISFIWDHFGKYILSVLEIAWKLVAGVVMGAFKILEGLFDFFDGLFTGNWSKMWHGLGEILSGAWSIIVSIFKTLLSLLVKTVTQFIPELLSAGVSLIEGLWNGIGSMAGWLGGKIESFIKSNVTGPVKKLLGIFSPSRVFAGFGKFSVQGLAQGFSDNAYMASAAAVVMAKKVTDSVQQHFSGASSAFQAVGVLSNSSMASDMYVAPHKAAHRKKKGRTHDEYGEYPLHVTVNVQGNVWAEKQLAKALVTDMRDELIVLARRNGGRTGL